MLRARAALINGDQVAIFIHHEAVPYYEGTQVALFDEGLLLTFSPSVHRAPWRASGWEAELMRYQAMTQDELANEVMASIL